jgi:hypothetical protein
LIQTACIRDVLGLNLGLNIEHCDQVFAGFVVPAKKMLRQYLELHLGRCNLFILFW